MKVFRELFIRGDSARLDAVAEDIGRSLTDGWTRDADAEAHMRSVAVGGRRKVYCFACPRRSRRPAATIFLLNKDPGPLFVANIVPHEKHELSYEEYNTIMEDFFRLFAEPAAERNGARAEMTEPQADLERWLPGGVADKLRVFCSIANKRTGSSHPMDRERWYNFLVAAHEANADLNAPTLARWLTEAGGWDDEMAERLAIEYEFARGLLSYANGERVGS
jgi:hypothetical protein